MSAMSEMCRVIREETQKHAPTLQALPDDVLRDYVDIVGAFYGDLRDECDRRREQRESGA